MNATTLGRGMRVYVAGPVNGSGTQNSNARKAIDVAEFLSNRGFVPFVPNLYWLWSLQYEKSEALWLEQCHAWLLTCDCVLRLPGISPGADGEIELATAHGIQTIVVPLGVDDYMWAARQLAARMTNGHRGPVPRLPLRQLVPAPATDVNYPRLAEHLYPALNEFQRDVEQWEAKQPFAGGPAHHPLLGVVEELGELAHAHLKNEQGIRGFDDEQKTREAKEDAIGDLLVYLVNYCSKSGLRLGDSLERAWSVVRRRDWNKNPQNGQGPYSSMP